MGPIIRAQIVDLIRYDPRATLSLRVSQRFSEHDLKIDDEMIRVVYDRRRKDIVAVLAAHPLPQEAHHEQTTPQD